MGGADGAMVSRQYGLWVCLVGLRLYATGPTPREAVLDAMEKEATDAK